MFGTENHLRNPAAERPGQSWFLYFLEIHRGFRNPRLCSLAAALLSELATRAMRIRQLCYKYGCGSTCAESIRGAVGAEPTID